METENLRFLRQILSVPIPESHCLTREAARRNKPDNAPPIYADRLGRATCKYFSEAYFKGNVSSW